MAEWEESIQAAAYRLRFSDDGPHHNVVEVEVGLL